MQLFQVVCPSFLWNAMKATQIQSKVKWTVHSLQLRHVLDEQLGLDARLFQFLLGELNGAWGEIHAGDFPASLGKRDHVRTCATANVNGAAGWMILDEFKQFGGTNACIPGWLTEIEELKLETAEQVLHFYLQRGSQM